MKDRISTHAGRVQLTHISGDIYDMAMADDPIEVGTALNKALFDFSLAAIGTTAGTSTAYTLAGDGGFTLTDGATIRFKLHTKSGDSPTINVNGTGAKALKTINGTAMPETAAGTWIVATYSTTLGFFVLSGVRGSAPDFIPDYIVALMGWSPLYSVLTEV